MLLKRFFYFFAFVTALLFLNSCGNNNKVPDEFIIHGKLKNSLGEKITLQQLKADSIKPIDSVNIDENGEFILKYKPNSISFYLLKISKDNFITLLTDKGEMIEITGNLQQLASEYSVTGSAGSSLIWELNDHTRKNYRKADSLFKAQIIFEDSSNYPLIKQQLDSMYEVIFENQRQFVQNFIKRNNNSLASLMALYQVFGRQKILNERDHFSYYKLLDSTLFLLYPQNDYVLELHTRVTVVENALKEKKLNLLKLDSGMVAPDIKMKNIGGYPQHLSSLKGRYTLIFFWAASSQPSINALNTFKWLHKKYREKGFQIYAVSLDNDRQTWEYVVREHKLSWIHVSDLLGWDSSVVKDYCLDSIPYAVLIDKNGRIIQRGISSDELSILLYKIYKF